MRQSHGRYIPQQQRWARNGERMKFQGLHGSLGGASVRVSQVRRTIAYHILHRRCHLAARWHKRRKPSGQAWGLRSFMCGSCGPDPVGNGMKVSTTAIANVFKGATTARMATIKINKKGISLPMNAAAEYVGWYCCDRKALHMVLYYTNKWYSVSWIR